MPDVYRSFFVPAAAITAARATVAGVPGHDGMFTVPMNQAGTGYRACGNIRATSPFLAADSKAAFAEVSSASAAQIAECVDSVDITGEGPEVRIPKLEAEIDATVSAIDWVQPTGAQDAIEKGAFRKHNGKTWVSLQDANVFEPGVASWRETWGSATDTPPDWVQPTGAQDAYRTGERVSHAGSTWYSARPANVWEPGTADSGWVEEDAGGGGDIPRWSNLGGTGPSGSYMTGDRVIHDRPQDNGNDWIFESTFSGNTTEPGRDGAFDRFWTPIERV